MRAVYRLCLLSFSWLVACGDMDKGVTVHNTAPVVRFDSPIEGTEFQVAEAIPFVATVTDKESGPTDLQLEWTSDLDGLLEEGTTPSADGTATFTTAGLTEGLHTLTLKATDLGGQIGSDYMTVSIETDCLALTACDYDEDGYTEEQGDCDDNDDGRYPGAEELENGIDDDCDGLVDEGTQRYDDDGDGYTELEGDCNDDDAGVSPVADEIADGVDQDCDELIDEGTDVYDDDGDGFSEEDGDCNDDNSAVYPGAVEVANGVDDDCDEVIDEGSDGYDDDGDGYTELAGDCDDTDPLVSPIGLEVCGDGLDNDCDSYVDGEDDDTDEDGDGFSACEGDEQDCDDEDEDIHPDADEVCDEVDNDCDGDIDADDIDTDADGDGQSACGLDCNDADDSIFFGGTEICDLLGVDEDCDGEINEADAVGLLTFYVDADEDGFGGESTVEACSIPEGAETTSTDCDDAGEDVHPDAIEVCDGIDNNCEDGIDEDSAVGAPTWYYDGDGDGFGSTPSVACEAPSDSFVSVDGDCNDADDRAYPGATEYCDGILNNCDLSDSGADGDEAVDRTTWYRDADVDGFPDEDVTDVSCEVPDGYMDAVSSWDCDDTDWEIKPGAAEHCDDTDWNCDDEDTEVGALDCVEYSYDGDGDTHGISGDYLCLCDPGDVANYTVPRDDVLAGDVDCCDIDSSTFLGATGWRSSRDDCLSWDANCDGIIQKELGDTWEYDGCDLDYDTWSSLACYMDVGWDGSSPSCGEGDYWVNGCSVVDEGYEDWFGIWHPDYECDVSYYYRSQRCH